MPKLDTVGIIKCKRSAELGRPIIRFLQEIGSYQLEVRSGDGVPATTNRYGVIWLY